MFVIAYENGILELCAIFMAAYRYTWKCTKTGRANGKRKMPLTEQGKSAPCPAEPVPRLQKHL